MIKEELSLFLFLKVFGFQNLTSVAFAAEISTLSLDVRWCPPSHPAFHTLSPQYCAIPVLKRISFALNGAESLLKSSMWSSSESVVT